MNCRNTFHPFPAEFLVMPNVSQANCIVLQQHLLPVQKIYVSTVLRDSGTRNTQLLREHLGFFLQRSIRSIGISKFEKFES